LPVHVGAKIKGHHPLVEECIRKDGSVLAKDRSQDADQTKVKVLPTLGLVRMQPDVHVEHLIYVSRSAHLASAVGGNGGNCRAKELGNLLASRAIEGV